ncbi:hypothetical protein WN48_07869 [Eufriesea mexicana]|nr:hypothetical protein WN48_07869 [Eufriesea mexicana]
MSTNWQCIPSKSWNCSSYAAFRNGKRRNDFMDISQGLAINAYYTYLEHLHSVASTVYNRMILRAAEEERRKMQKQNSV